jgi:hypothetical protein
MKSTTFLGVALDIITCPPPSEREALTSQSAFLERRAFIIAICKYTLLSPD